MNIASLPAEFVEWFRHGLERGWVTAPFCVNHDGPPLLEGEDLEERWEGDECLYCVRLLT